MDTNVFRAWITSAAGMIEANRDHLTQLDAAIGDADHGINLDRGFAAVLVALDAKPAATPGAVLILAGSTLISKVGGASGPLYGMAFRRAGQALGAAEDVDLTALANPGDPNYATAVQNAKAAASTRLQNEVELQGQIYNVLTADQKAVAEAMTSIWPVPTTTEKTANSMAAEKTAPPLPRPE